MKKLSLILIIVGILAALSPLAGQLYTKYLEYRMMVEWLDSEDAASIEETAEETAAADPEQGFSQLQEVFAPDGAKAEGVTENTGTPSPNKPKVTPKPAKPAVKQTVLGIIRIDKIKVKDPIVEGVEASNLKVGIGHIPGTAALGQPGNSALAGHRSYTFGKFFNRLDELVVGDEIIITTKKEELKYKVYEKLVVLPNDVSVIKGSKNDNIITLITCTPIYVATHRLIIHARLEDKTLKEP
ncbi:MAG: class D sortase [Ruminiclostridium sp.]|nr:class D sortase [Ruminiclostridium sp.]